jgi:hypothetical protein
MFYAQPPSLYIYYTVFYLLFQVRIFTACMCSALLRCLSIYYTAIGASIQVNIFDPQSQQA